MVSAIDHNFNLHARKIPEGTNGMTVAVHGGMSSVDSGLSCDTFNVIHITDCATLKHDDFFSAVDGFRKKEFAFCIWVSGENLSPDVKKMLKRASVHLQNATPAMALDMNAYEPRHDPRHDDIAVVASAQGVGDFAKVVAANWTPPDENVIRYFAETTGRYLDPANGSSLAVYYCDDGPVSAVEMFTGDDRTVGIYALATLQGHRGRGIGSSMFTFALNIAKKRRHSVAVLQASMAGARIYEKYGFRTMTWYYEYA